jgi:hypothetical protein
VVNEAPMHRLDAEPVDECAGWELGESGLRSGPSAVAAAYSWSVQPPMGHEHAVGDESVVIADDQWAGDNPGVRVRGDLVPEPWPPRGG